MPELTAETQRLLDNTDGELAAAVERRNAAEDEFERRTAQSDITRILVERVRLRRIIFCLKGND